MADETAERMSLWAYEFAYRLELADFLTLHPLQSLRAQFAAQALQGLLVFSPEGEHQMDVSDVACDAVKYADALLAELSKPKKRPA